MTKADLITTIADKAMVTKRDANDMIDAFNAAIRKELKLTGSSKVPGIGTISGVKIKGRRVYNFNTGETKYSGKTIKYVTLRGSRKLKKSV